MKIDMETTAVTMQEVVDLFGRFALNLTYVAKSNDADEALYRFAEAFQSQASQEDEPRLQAMLAGVADYINADGDGRPLRKSSPKTKGSQG